MLPEIESSMEALPTNAVGRADPRRPTTYKNLHLLAELIRRDFNARFTGSALGLAWALLQPLSLVFLYWFVFTFMIPQPVTAGGQSYVYFLISGLIPWLGISEGILRSTTTIVDNAPMVRRLAFRSELLVVVPNATALILELVGFVLLTVALGVQGRSLRDLWILPFAFVLQFSLQVGLGWMLAAAYVFFRDLTQILTFALSIVFYLSPILYPVGGRFARFFAWNPMTALLGLFRSAVLTSALPDLASVVFLVAVSTTTFAAGLFLFRLAQPTLADLI